MTKVKVNINVKSRKKMTLRGLQKKVIIKNVHFTLESGTSTLLIGTSGAGKSTIENSILGFTNFNGDVTFSDAKPKVAFIAQHPPLNKEETVLQSVYYSGRFQNRRLPKKEALRRANYYIEMLGLGPIKNSKLKDVSGGQCQRVAIANELIRNADVLICDEPDTGLDFGTSKSLAEDIKNIAKNEHKTVLVVSHNVYNAEYYDRLMVLAKDKDNIGGLAYFGPPRRALLYFGVNDYTSILTKINPSIEHGDGLGDYYIKHFNKY